MAGHLIVYISAPSLEMAESIGSGLVEKRLAACVNIIPKIVSIYRWRGEVCRDEEVLLVVKTRDELYDEVEKNVLSMHSYEVPEIVAMRLAKGSEPYLQWVDDSCRQP